MPYKDKEKKKAFQTASLKKRKDAWLLKNGPCSVCRSNEQLVVSRADFSKDAASHFWSYSEKKREIYLRSFIVRCRSCHDTLLREHLRGRYTGTKGNASKLRNKDVWAIRGRLLGRESTRCIARDYGVEHQTIQSIQNGETWSWLPPGKRKVFGIAVARAVAD